MKKYMLLTAFFALVFSTAFAQKMTPKTLTNIVVNEALKPQNRLKENRSGIFSMGAQQHEYGIDKTINGELYQFTVCDFPPYGIFSDIDDASLSVSTTSSTFSPVAYFTTGDVCSSGHVFSGYDKKNGPLWDDTFMPGYTGGGKFKELNRAYTIRMTTLARSLDFIK